MTASNIRARGNSASSICAATYVPNDEGRQENEACSLAQECRRHLYKQQDAPNGHANRGSRYHRVTFRMPRACDGNASDAARKSISKKVGPSVERVLELPAAVNISTETASK